MVNAFIHALLTDAGRAAGAASLTMVDLPQLEDALIVYQVGRVTAGRRLFNFFTMLVGSGAIGAGLGAFVTEDPLPLLHIFVAFLGGGLLVAPTGVTVFRQRTL